MARSSGIPEKQQSLEISQNAFSELRMRRFRNVNVQYTPKVRGIDGGKTKWHKDHIGVDTYIDRLIYETDMSPSTMFHDSKLFALRWCMSLR